MRKKLLAVVMMVAISLPLVAYAWIEIDGSVWTEKNQEAPSGVTKFEAVVNGMRNVDVFVCVNISDGLTEKEAELIAGTTFIQVRARIKKLSHIKEKKKLNFNLVGWVKFYLK